MPRIEPPLHRLLKRQSVLFLAVATIASSLLISTGLLVDNAFWSTLLVVLGGSALGTCFGIVFGSVRDVSALQRVRELIEESLSSSLSAPDHELEAFRKAWHHYIVTQIDKTPVWRYRKIDLSRTSVPGKLVTTFNVPGPQGHIHTYSIEGFLAEPRLIVVQTPSGGSELPIIHVYPRAAERFRSRHAGLALLQSWDGDHLTVPVLMCDEPIDLEHANVSEGTLPGETYAKLNEIWEREAAAVGLVLVKNPEMPVAKADEGNGEK